MNVAPACGAAWGSRAPHSVTRALGSRSRLGTSDAGSSWARDGAGMAVSTRMNQHHAQHVLLEIWIKRERVAQKIVDARDRFDAGESAAGNNEGQERLPFCLCVFGVGFLKVRDQAITQLNGVA